jgi:hypothetical protein
MLDTRFRGYDSGGRARSLQMGALQCSRDRIRPSFANDITLEIMEGAGKTGHRLVPVAPVREKSTGQEPQDQPRTPGLPCAVVLTLMARSPW